MKERPKLFWIICLYLNDYFIPWAAPEVRRLAEALPEIRRKTYAEDKLLIIDKSL